MELTFYGIDLVPLIMDGNAFLWSVIILGTILAILIIRHIYRLIRNFVCVIYYCIRAREWGTLFKLFFGIAKFGLVILLCVVFYKWIIGFFVFVACGLFASPERPYRYYDDW